MAYTQLAQITARCDETGKAFWQIVQESDCQERDVTPAQSFADMQRMYRAMEQADAAYDPSLRSASGMAGGDGARFSAYRMRENRLLGDYLTEVMERALKMAESNACMRPDRGRAHCRFLRRDSRSASELRLLPSGDGGKAGGGPVCGCAESAKSLPPVPASPALRADVRRRSVPPAPWPPGALSYLEGGDCEEICHACALAMKSLLGLTCDPVAGLVEVPCIKRNASGAVNAVVASQMAMSGIRSAIPPDEVIDSMRRIGHLLPACLRETGQDGLATTPTGLHIAQQMAQQ